ncbi:hypothetical protein PtB15_7B94 [Puccinia triticina]|nr:hypothetical protein PtB15_7B94 [Puccinia triticina]
MNTPKGQEVQILVEELMDCYKFDIAHHICDVRKGSQKLNDFIKLNPNAINTQSAPFCVMESGAISQYLCSRIDQNNNFRFADCTQSSEMEQWISWGLSHLGILVEECIHFARYASTRDTYSIEYYQNQILEAFDELEQHLAQRASIVARS